MTALDWLPFSFTAVPWLTLLLIIPLVGSIAVLFIKKPRNARLSALVLSLIPLIITVLLWLAYNDVEFSEGTSFKFIEKADWVGEVGISYLLGVDGLSLPFLFLSALLTTLGLIFSWDVKDRANQFFALLLVLEVGLFGVFTALDFFMFYIFWEVVLIPMFFLIAIWGGHNKHYASIKFFIYTHVASVVMLIGIFVLYFASGGKSFSMIDIAARLGSEPTLISTPMQMGVFLAFLFGFGVKMPLVPFHTWLPDAHVQAPTAGSVLLAGVLLKMGGYGMLRVAVTILPDAAVKFMVPMAVLGVVSIVYAAFICLAQRDFKKLVAYSSVSHMGLVMLGISTMNVIGINGAVLQMFAHGLITGVLFMIAGVIHHKAGTRDIPSLQGLTQKMPIAMFLLLAGCLASLGLPAMASFPSEVLVFVATYKVYGYWLLVPLIGVVVTAAYYLWTVQRVAFGRFKVKLRKNDPLVHPPENGIRDVDWYEFLPIAILLALIVMFGVYPRFVLDMINEAVTGIASASGGAISGVLG